MSQDSSANSNAKKTSPSHSLNVVARGDRTRTVVCRTLGGRSSTRVNVRARWSGLLTAMCAILMALTTTFSAFEARAELAIENMKFFSRPTTVQMSAPFLALSKDFIEFRREREAFEKAGVHADLLPYITLPKSGRVDRVVVAVHGLSDSSYLFRELLAPLTETSDTAVIGVLLKGHGTKPADLRDVRAYEWQKQVDRALSIAAWMVSGSKKSEVNVVGFSLGGALVVDAAIRNPHLISRAVLIAPLFGFYSPVAGLAREYRKIPFLGDYEVKDSGGTFYTYPAIHYNAIEEAYQLAKSLRKKTKEKINTRFSIVISEIDTSISNEKIHEFVQRQSLDAAQVQFVPTVAHRNLTLRLMSPDVAGGPFTPNPFFAITQKRVLGFLTEGM